MTGNLCAGTHIRTVVLLGSATLGLMSSPAMAEGKEQSYVLTYAGLLDVIGGDTRVYAGGMADIYTERGIGLHADIVTVDRFLRHNLSIDADLFTLQALRRAS